MTTDQEVHTVIGAKTTEMTFSNYFSLPLPTRHWIELDEYCPNLAQTFSWIPDWFTQRPKNQHFDLTVAYIHNS